MMRVILRKPPVVLAALGVLAACGDSDAVGPAGDHVPDPVNGATAFAADCASCHASGDGFDLAYFDFPTHDVVRRGVAHVDTATALDIDAYLRSLDAPRVGRSFRPFQKAGTASDEGTFWRGLFGTDGWPEDLTVAELAALDLRDVPVPLPFPAWSVEGAESDWMPNLGLPAPELQADGGALAAAVDAYYAAPDDDRLLELIRTFQRVTRRGGPVAEPLCRGTAGSHVEATLCFEARRWISSLAAIHLLKQDEQREVPYEVAEVWWDTGEAAVSAHFRDDHVGNESVAAWLYMSSVFVPDGFLGPGSILAEDAGYMGQFLVRLGLQRVAALVTLRRMVTDGPIHRERPEQAYWDLNLAALRSPEELVLDVLEFGLDYMEERQGQGHAPSGEGIEVAGFSLSGILRRLDDRRAAIGDPARVEAVENRVRALMAGLEDETGAPR